MFVCLSRPMIRLFAVLAVLAVAGTLAACGGSDDTAETSAKTAPSAPAAAALDKQVDTAATAKEADATEVPADELEAQTEAIERGLKDAGFDATNQGAIGEAKETITVETSWAVYVYGSDRAAAEFLVSLKELRPEPANFELFRIGNRVYYASMTSALSDADRAKLTTMAEAAEGAIAAR